MGKARGGQSLIIGRRPMPSPPIHQTMQTAARHHQAGRLDQAEALYRRVLLEHPSQPEALHLLGIILSQRGQHEAALELLRKAVAIHPRSADFQSNLGIVLANLGRTQEALEAFEQALRLRPGHAQAQSNLGGALRAAGRMDEAIEAFGKAAASQPGNAAAWHQLGDLLRVRGRLPEAVQAFEKELAVAPNNAEAYNFLGVTLAAMAEAPQAMEAFRKSLDLRPDNADAHNNLAAILAADGQLEQAIAEYRKAIELRPDFPGAYSNLGNLLKDCNRLEEALALFRKALQLNPELAQAHDNLLFALFVHPTMEPREIFLQHVQWNRQHAAPLAGQIQKHDNDPSPNRRLRIGYVSPDFREHSVAFFVENLLANHDPAQVEIFCYAELSRPDLATARFQQLARQWRWTTGQADAQVAELIRQDRIDILVDLAGHTSDNRLLVFARKPAPIQVTYCGYPGTTGLTTMDYRLTDGYADPPGQTEHYHTEQLVRLPQTFLCFRPSPSAPPVGPLAALANGHITFASFNHVAKITDPTVELWSQILRQVPDSRLLLKSPGLGDAAPRQQLLERFAAQGISAQRLELQARIASLGSHLQLYHRADIALDPFPYHGTTTTCEALWMGVPVVSLAGKHHASRVGVSLLSNVGLPQLIAQDPRGYVQIAVGLANDLPTLIELRIGLRDRVAHSPLLDAPGFARSVEAAYREMWRRWCQTQG